MVGYQTYQLETVKGHALESKSEEAMVSTRPVAFHSKRQRRGELSEVLEYA